jgi:hypothetical protein
MIRSVGNPVGSLLLAVGRADVSFKWNLSLLLIVPPGLLIGALWGIVGLVITQALLMAVLLVPGWYFLIWPTCGARLQEYLKCIASALIPSIVAVVTSYTAVFAMDGSIQRLALAAVIALPVYVGVSYFLNRPWLNAVYELIVSRRTTISTTV